MEAHSARDESAGGKRSGRLITFSQHGARPAIEASGGQSAAEGQRPIQVMVAVSARRKCLTSDPGVIGRGMQINMVGAGCT
jgi:hypothetical protein